MLKWTPGQLDELKSAPKTIRLKAPNETSKPFATESIFAGNPAVIGTIFSTPTDQPRATPTSEIIGRKEVPRERPRTKLIIIMPSTSRIAANGSQWVRVKNRTEASSSARTFVKTGPVNAATLSFGVRRQQTNAVGPIM